LVVAATLPGLPAPLETGASDYLAVLVAERQQTSLEDQHVQSETRRATSLAALYKALAGAP